MSVRVASLSRFCCLYMLCSLQLMSTQSALATDLSSPATINQVYNRLINLQPDKSKNAYVDYFELKRPSTVLTFKDGYFYFCQPIHNKLSAALFIGNGNVTFSPKAELEKNQLRHEFDSKIFYDTFNIAFVIFADELLEELRDQGIHLEKNFTPNYVNRYIHDFLEYILDEEGQYLGVDIIKTLLEGHNNGLFCAQINTHNFGRVVYELNPFEKEQVKLFRIKNSNTKQVISESSLENSSEKLLRLQTSKNEIHQIKLTAKIDWDNEFIASSTVGMKIKHPQHWIYIKLDKSFKVFHVERKGYGPVNFIKPEGTPYLWIHCDDYAKPGELLEYDIEYSGSPLIEIAGRLVLNPESIWYPQLDGNDNVRYDLTFFSPRDLRLSSIGTKVEDAMVNGMHKTRWVSEQPSNKIYFSLGDFRELHIQDERLPDFHIWQYHATHSGKKIQNVGKDVAQSYLLFQTIFGKLSYDKLWVTEIPFLHGETYDGHINLTTKVFDDYKHPWNEIFIAHEIAHLWWGVGLKYKTYHDRWLAESFAEYSALMYLETIEKDPEATDQILISWKDQLIKEQQRLIKSNKTLKSLWLGNRLAEVHNREDFELIVYKKGAWVLHMLRNMMKDLENLDDSRFQNMLKAYYKTYQGKEVSTLNFQEFVETYTKQDLDWFFDQWVVGTDIPKYQYYYTYRKGLENTYDLKIVVVQKTQGNKAFKMMVPMQISFGNNQFLRFRSWIKEPKTVIEINNLPLRPKHLTFNYLNSVLCDQEEIQKGF